MSSPSSLEPGASRARRFAVAALAALVLASLAGPAATVRASSHKDELNEAKRELRETRERVRARTKRIRTIQRRMNKVATRISRTEGRLFEAEERIEKLEREIVVLEVRNELLQAQLDERVRSAYKLGASPVLYLLTATSAAQAATRFSFLAEMNRRDAELAASVQATQERLTWSKAEVVRTRHITELYRRSLEADRELLNRKMRESRNLLRSLHAQAREIRYEISRIRPFAVCPLDGPHAIADDFGIIVHHPPNEGGVHVHQGNDMYAAEGVPIVAPFDGTAINARNKVGGLAVKVYGEYGYVYNAHLSRYGTLGPVQTGDVIGYVGSTGNAGGPHDHFEWHPGNGAAVDPHEFLMLVCNAPLMTF